MPYLIPDDLRFAKAGGGIKDASTDPGATKIPETDKTVKQIEDMLIKARVSLLIDAPWFGNLATRLRFIDATKWCPTAATDGRNFYFNRNFIAALKPGEIIFLIGHEVLHCVYDHMNKKWLGDRNRVLANIAQDHVINLDLIDAQLGEKINLVEICADWKYRGKIWEEVYDMLKEEVEQNGGKVPEGNYTLDIHLDGESGGNGNQDGDDANDGTNGPIRYSEDERAEISEEVREAVVQAAKANGAGNLPGGVKRLIDQLLNPQIDWRELLAMQIQSVIRANYTWQRPSRKGMDAGMYLPSMDREQTIDIAIAIDTSGSISQEMLRDFLSEVQGIMGQYNDFKVELWCFDTQVHNRVTITADTMSNFEEYELAGFGGTMFECNWEFMKEENIEPKKFVMFTDGYPCGGWGDEHYCDTLFIVHGGGYGEPPIAPFGLTVPYSREEGAKQAA